MDVLWRTWILGAWNGITGAGERTVNWFRAMPGKVKGALAGFGETISAPFRWGFNMIAGFWNNTVGRLSFSMPDWVPGLGGKGFSMPQLPRLAEGGIVRARAGGTAVIVGEGGSDEAVMPLPRGMRAMDGGGGARLVLDFGGVAGGSDEDRLMARWLHRMARGGKLRLRDSAGKLIAVEVAG
jgi:hypothetical protein